MATPEQDRKQPLVPPTPPGAEITPQVKRFSLLPVISVVFLIFAMICGYELHGYEVYLLFDGTDFEYWFSYKALLPLLIPALLIGIAGIVQCILQRNPRWNLILSIISTGASVALLLSPLYCPSLVS